MGYRWYGGRVAREAAQQVTSQGVGRIESYCDLIVWQKAMAMVGATYRLTAGFPSCEQYRLTSQLLRAAASVPANIAERHARGTRRDYANFVAIARGSLAEAETFLLLAVELGFTQTVDAQPILNAMTEISKMLAALRARLAPRE
jgi:four helix bundle protein